MTEEQEKKCDPEDLICQFQVLSNLKGLQSALGNETFKSRFPELEGLDQTIMERIKETDATLSEALQKCGFPSMDLEAETLIESKPETAIEEEV